MSLISEAERAYIFEGMECGVRNDGRKPLQYRELAVQSGILAQASGSASCQLGNTDVLVAIKVCMGRKGPCLRYSRDNLVHLFALVPHQGMPVHQTQQRYPCKAVGKKAGS